MSGNWPVAGWSFQLARSGSWLRSIVCDWQAIGRPALKTVSMQMIGWKIRGPIDFWARKTQSCTALKYFLWYCVEGQVLAPHRVGFRRADGFGTGLFAAEFAQQFVTFLSALSTLLFVQSAARES